MALDQAIYHPLTNKIYGVRGQWLFKFNADTAALEDSLRFNSNIGSGLSGITYIAGTLYIATSRTPNFDPQIFVYPPGNYPFRDIYTIDTATFTATGRFDFDSKLSYSFVGHVTDQYLSEGWYHLVNDGVNLYGHGNGGDFWKVDPSNLPGYARQSFGLMTDLCFDRFNNVLWATDPANHFISLQDSDFTTFNSSAQIGDPGPVNGVCYANAFNKVYCVRGDFSVLMVDASTAMPGFNNFPFSVFNTGRPNANPFKLKYVDFAGGHPFSNKVLIPTFADDSVVVWEPSTDTASSIKTGFTSPFDIVSTPIKSFALQTGLTGLKEILP